MNKIRMQRILSLLLVVVMIFSNGSLTALAAGGAHLNTDTTGINPQPTYPGGGSGERSTVQLSGGGFKISIVSLPQQKYEPTDLKINPYYGLKGKTAISVNGTSVIDNHSKGLYGISPIYLVDDIWNTNTELAIDTSLKVDLRKDAIKGKRITSDNLKAAASKSNISDNSIYKDIYKAFHQTNILTGTEDINNSLRMVSVNDKNSSDTSIQRNKDIINTILNLTISLYSKNGSMVKYLKGLQENNMQSGGTELLILIEPLGVVKTAGTLCYVTPANYILATTKLSASKYTSLSGYNEIMGEIDRQGNKDGHCSLVDFNGKWEKNYGLYSGTGSHILGTSKEYRRNEYVYTSAIGGGQMGGHDGDASAPLKYRESLASKVLFTGPYRWTNGTIERASTTLGDKMSMGGGFLASSDFIESTPTSKIKEASVSVSILGQSSGFTPSISMGITTTSSVDDTDLDTQVSTAITKLDDFANERGMTIETLNDYLSSDACIEILKIVIQDYTKAYTEKTSLSDKEETIDGKISAILEESKLGLDSIYIAKYMNLLMKNGTTDEETGQFTFNSDANKALIKYLYTMFDDDEIAMQY